MNKKTKEALDAMEHLRTPGDVVYVVMKRQKRSFLFHLWDTFIADTILSTVSDMKFKMMFLLATDEEGKLIEVKNGTISEMMNVPNWRYDDKEHFKKVTIENFMYKKVEKL
ncbi:hypothetical protein [Pseudogracilibacillus auburnensis]|uniref:hypothetical protein n=1 Tax=Pseudogracilibacillus auburnensis TaxID=1494959 RepID=UPI001A97271E|nr:hypothetical protein [Pseudogracilibacillus auburnensis]MBO1003864.1 hypothetical protein [Pseudogracilibacillus auburnensis]